MKRNVREMKLSEAHLMINYFLEADHSFLSVLGADPAKLPHFDHWYEILRQDFDRPIKSRHYFYLVWELDGVPVGHSNINDINYAKEAFMHLHIWDTDQRQTGNGTFFVRESIKIYFEKFELSQLYCQPYALNPAPNRTLKKVGFIFLKNYETIPGWINFHQPVNLWVLDRARFDTIIQ